MSGVVAYAPKVYHRSIALGLISSVLNYKVIIRLKRGVVYPNVQMLLLGPPSVTKKSTAVSKGISMLPTDQGYGCEINKAPQTFTTEGLMEYFAKLSKQKKKGKKGSQKIANCVYLRDEFGGLLADFNKQHLAGIKDLLCQIYDVDLSGYTMGFVKSTRHIDKVYMPMITATTFQRFKASVGTGNIADGWLTRFLYTNATEPGPWIPDEHYDTTDLYLFENLRRELAAINRHYIEHPEMKLSDETLVLWNNWNRDFHAEMANQSTNTQAFCSRLSNSALKISMLLAAERRMHEITPLLFNRATEYIEFYYKNALEIIDMLELTEITEIDSKASRKAHRILSVIQRKDEVTHRYVLQNAGMGITAKEVRAITRDLKERGLIEITDKGRGKGGLTYRFK